MIESLLFLFLNQNMILEARESLSPLPSAFLYGEHKGEKTEDACLVVKTLFLSLPGLLFSSHSNHLQM